MDDAVACRWLTTLSLTSVVDRPEVHPTVSDIPSSRLLLEHLPAIVTISASADPLLLSYINADVLRVLGYTPDAWLVTPDFWVTRIHSDDQQHVLEVLGGLTSTVRESFSLEYRLLARDGSVRWVRHDGARVLSETGKTLCWQSVLVDMTSQHKKADRLARQADLVRLLHVAAVAANESSAIEDALRTTIDAVCDRVGWPVGHVYLRERRGEPEIVPTGIWCLDDPVCYRALCDLTEQTRLVVGTGIVGTVFATGQPIWIPDVTTSPLFVRGQVGGPLGVRAAFAIPVIDRGEPAAVLEFYSPDVIDRDDELLAVMTQVGTQLGIAFEREHIRSELTAFAERLEWSNRELQDFASVASHDLQEPLRKVVAFGDRLKAKYGDQLGEQGSDYLERMQNAARRMQILIDDLLSYSRVTTKARPFAPVDLDQLVREVVSDLEERIDWEGGQVQVGALPVVLADASQMRQLFQNLIVNGLKFRAPGRSPVVRIEAELHERQSGILLDDGQNRSGIRRLPLQYRVVVADNGIGFEPQYAERIFSIFERLHGRDEYEGTGIGLAICRKIVERHGGTITAEGDPNVGARFGVTLPASRPVDLPKDMGTTS